MVCPANAARRCPHNDSEEKQADSQILIKSDKAALFSATTLDQICIGDRLDTLACCCRDVVTGHGKNLLTAPAEILVELELHTAGSSGTDRKSTRLNSSHSQISYAVFCLKKKKKHIRC